MNWGIRRAKACLLVIALLCTTLCTAFLNTSFAAWIDSKEGQVAELDAVLMELETHYGMIKFKERIYGVSYDSVRAKYRTLIEQALLPEEALGLTTTPAPPRQVLSPEEFRQLIVAVAAEFRDGHLNVLRQTSSHWTLGIRTAAIDGRLFVTGFNQNFFVGGQTSTPLRVGDEILTIDGRPVQALAREFMPYMQLATYDTRFAAALESVVNRSHRRLMPVRDGAAVRLEFQRPNSMATEPRTIVGVYHWVNTNELSEVSAYFPSNEQRRLQPADAPFIYGVRSTPSYFSTGVDNLALPPGTVIDTGLLLNESIKRAKTNSERILAQMRSNLMPGSSPTPDQLVAAYMEAGASLQDIALSGVNPVTRLTARTIRYKDKTLGVIRIPDYSPETFQDVMNEIRWLAQALSVMEHSTDGLIIDQLSNGGGYVYQVVQLARLFASQGDIKGVTIDMRVSETFLARAQTWSENHPALMPPIDETQIAAGGPNFAQIFLSKQFITQLRERLAQGNRWTGAIPYMGSVETYTPGEFGRIVGQDRATYTKPILLLNDSRSASGGDFFPAIMQANGRAVVFGETSMGLGGPVYRNTETPGSEMFARCTFGYCERSDGQPIENLGVVPEVPRYITRLDLADSFRTYAKDALETAVGLVSGTAVQTLRDELEKRHNATMPRKPSFIALQNLLKPLDEVVFTDATVDVVTAAYAHFFQVAASINTTDLTADDWARLRIPLPRLLVSRDVLLGSLRSRDAVLERLQELKTLLPDQSLHGLINTMVDGLNIVGTVHLRDCQSLLTPAAPDGGTPTPEGSGPTPDAAPPTPPAPQTPQ